MMQVKSIVPAQIFLHFFSSNCYCLKKNDEMKFVQSLTFLQQLSRIRAQDEIIENSRT